MDWIGLDLTFPITDPTWIFLLVLLIILFAPILLNKLRIPHIIGMILAGLAIGEHGFNILARDSSFQLFGKVGLYYIMFLAGLEMNMGDFKETRNKALVLGLLAFIVPIGIGFVANVSYLKYGVITSVLLASMYASHTLVAYPIVTRFGISRHRSVSIAVGGTAVTDTLTLLVLAVIGGLFKGETGGLFWIWLVVKVIFLGALIIYFFPRIGRWFFHRYNDNVMQFIFVLAMVFLGAGLMELVGMEGILGAFLAGLVLNRLIPHVSPLMDHLEFVGNALFIPYFLIGVGMLINLRVIFGHGDALKVAAVMITMALTGKWIACWLTQKIYKMSVLERNLMYGLSNAQAAATLAAVLVGYNIIIDNQCAGLKLATGDDVGRVTYRTDGIKDYTDYLYESINGDLSGLNVCIDCANGASAAVARQLFPRLGAKCTFIGVEPDGKNINAGVGSTHLDNLEKAVVEGGFDCGIAFDGDADRCLACDEKGQEIDGDKVIALLAKNMKEKGCLDGNTAVVTVMSNLGFIKFMESQGIHTEKTAVGDRYVLENMRENGYAIGGEQSGHVILLHHATTGDGELTAGKLLKLLAESGKKMSELNGIYAQYPQVLVNVAANAAQKAAYKEDKVLADFIENEQQKLMDMGRVLVRVSGTEPKIRVMVEGQDLEAIDLCAKRIVDKINERIIEG